LNREYRAGTPMFLSATVAMAFPKLNALYFPIFR